MNPWLGTASRPGLPLPVFIAIIAAIVFFWWLIRLATPPEDPSRDELTDLRDEIRQAEFDEKNRSPFYNATGK